MGRYPRCPRRGEREVRGGTDAEAARCALWCRAAEGRMVEVEGHALHRRRGARLCAGGQRTQGIAAYRLHLRRLARRCARPVRQGILGIDRCRDSSGRRVGAAQHDREVRAGAIGEARAGLRAGLRRHPGIHEAQVRGRSALPPNPALAHRQARGGGGHARGAALAHATGMTSSIATISRVEAALEPAHEWFASRGWAPFDFQREVWSAYLAGESGLIHAATGTGKTYAAWWGPLLEAMQEQSNSAQPRRPSLKSRRRSTASPLRVLWITPLR